LMLSSCAALRSPGSCSDARTDPNSQSRRVATRAEAHARDGASQSQRRRQKKLVLAYYNYTCKDRMAALGWGRRQGYRVHGEGAQPKAEGVVG
jgi:hypothetical protein